MAVDTRDKRFSLIGFGSPTPRVLPIADGTFSAADRAMLLYLYHGLTLGAVAVPVTVAFTLYVPNPAAQMFVPSPSAAKEIPG